MPAHPRCLLLLAPAVLVMTVQGSTRANAEQGGRPTNKSVCEDALTIYENGTDARRDQLRDYVYRTFDDINQMNLAHGGADMQPEITAKPYTAMANEISAQCQVDVSDTIYLALARLYKKEANPELTQ